MSAPRRSHMKFANKAYNIAVQLFKISNVGNSPDVSKLKAVLSGHQSLELTLKALVLKENQPIHIQYRSGWMMKGFSWIHNQIQGKNTHLSALKTRIDGSELRKNLLYINKIRNKLQHDNIYLIRYWKLTFYELMVLILDILIMLLDEYGMITDEIEIVRNQF